MKFIKIVLVVILLGLSALLLIGVFVPEVDDRFEITIDRPLLQVYAGMLNLENAPDWVNGLERIERSSGFLAMPGSTFKLYYSGSETDEVYDLEVLEVVPIRSVKFKMQDDKFEFVVTVNFESEGTSTKLDTYVHMKGKDLLSRSFLPLMCPMIMNIGKDNFESYKQLQES